MKNTLLTFLALATILPAQAQAPGVAIFEQSKKGLSAEEHEIGQQVEAFMKEGKTLSLEASKILMKTPIHHPLSLPASLDQELTPTAIANLAEKSSYRVGWAYLCKHCDSWHANLAGGYAITTDGTLATCAHVIKTDLTKFRKGALIAVDHSGKVFPVTSIYAYDAKIDGAIIKIDAETTPLALNDQVTPGDAVFCLSRPLKQGKYFSEGIVNRFFWSYTARGNDPNSIKAMGALKLNVSTRWAPGSSGSAVLDTYGNAIGHVALIKTLAKPQAKKDAPRNPTLITIHTATPARAMMALTREP